MTDTVNPTAEPVAEQAAAEAANRAATQAADNASATAASERALKAAREAASKALAALTDLTHSVREQAAALAERFRPQLSSAASSAVGYAKEQPAKTLLASAALGAAVVGLYMLVTRSSQRHHVALRPSLKAQFGDAAADAFDAARDGVTDTVDTLRDKAQAAAERLRQPLNAATSYAQEDPLKAVVIAAVAGAVAMALIATVVSSQRDD